MSFFGYLDEEYFNLQDFVSTLVDTLPILDAHSIPDDKTFVQTLIDQNKVYAKKVISLYQKFNTMYSNASHSLEKSERASTNAFVDRLKEKLHDYEEEIQRLKSDNESYIKQLKHLSQQNDPLQQKDSLGYPFSSIQEGQGQAQMQLTSRELSPNVTKNMNNSFNIPSPIPRSSNLSRVSKDALFDLEQMFQSAEYKRAMDMLTQLDYEVPQEVPVEKINKWLAISNRIKDSQFLEILQKLKNLSLFEAENKGQGGRNSLERNLDELFDQQKLNLVDKIYWILDEKISDSLNTDKNVGKNKQELRTEGSVYETAYFRDTESGSREDMNLNEKQLRQKINYLKESLQASEMILRDREAEIRTLKKRIRITDEGDMPRKSEGFGEIASKGRVRTNGEAKEVRVERDMYRRKYEESIKELDDYKEKYNNVQEEAEEYRIRYENFERKIQNISENAERLKEENDSLRRHIETGSSKQDLLDDKEESIENHYRNKPPSLGKDIEVTDFMGDKTHQRTPTVGQIVPAEGPQNFKGVDIKGNLLLGNAIQVQKNNLYNTKQALTEFKTYILEKLRSLDIESQAILSPKLEPETDSAEPTTEVQRALRTNTSIIKGINNEIRDLKRDTINIINKLSWSKPLQSPKRKNTESDATLRERISIAEEKLMENLSQTLQSLSKLTASLHKMGDSGLEGALAEDMAEVFEDVQSVHSRIERTIQEFPEFSTHEIKIEGKPTVRQGHIAEFQYDANTNTLRKKLATDRNDLTTQLRTTLQKFESTVANDALERLSEEISKNQNLQDIIEAKNLLLHRLNMLFAEGMETCETTIRHLFQLADSEDAQRIVESILDNMRAFRRTFADANAQYKSPKKRLSLEEEELRTGSVQEKATRSRSGLKSSFKESRMSPDKSPGISKKASMHSIKWGDREDRSSLPEEAGWLVTEKQKLLEEMNSRCEEWREKVKSIERENFELVRQLEMLKESSDRMQKRNEELKDALEQKQDECRNIAREASRDYEIRGREIEELRRRVDHMDRENQELRNYRLTTESVLKRASDQVGHLKLGYFSEVNILKEENEILEKQRQEVVAELDRKTEENAKLNQLIDTLQKFSNKQLEGLREKEEKVLLLANQKRESEVMVRELERQIETLAGRNKTSLEKAKESMDDVSNMKYELSKATERYEVLQRELETVMLRNRDLVQERDNLLRQKEILENDKRILEDKMKKISEIVEITKSELRKSHELLEQKTEEIKRKDREIQRLREAGLQKEDPKEPDYVTYLKRELQVRNEELQRVKADYRRTLDANEKLNSEIDNLKATSRLGMSSNRPSVIGERNISQQTTRKDFNKSGEKDIRGIERETRSAFDMKRHDSSVLLHEPRNRAFEGSHTERPERGASGQKLFTLGDSGAKMQPSASLAQQKDKEIQRLNQVVKDLTHSLQSSQNSTNSQIRRHIQFSSPQ